MSWKSVPISALGTVVTGKTPSTKNQSFWGGNHPFITPSDINYRHYYCRITERTVSEAAKTSFKGQWLPKDAILFTCIGNTIGKCALSPSECLTNQQINSIIAHHYNDPKFVYYLLINNISIFRKIGLGGGTATPIINKSVFAKLQLKVPPKELQSKIANILSSYDDLIENNHRRIKLLEEAASLIYEEWFIRFRFPAHEQTRFIDDLPEGWIKVMLNKICVDLREQIIPSKVSPDTPYIGLEHIPRKSITLDSWGNACDVESSKFKFSKGNILFGKIRPYLHKIGIAFVNGITSSDTIVIRSLDESNHYYLLFLLSSDEFVSLASKTGREGSKMPRADWKFLSKHIFLLPSKNVLNNFNALIEPIVIQLENLVFLNQKLAQTRDLLLPKLMNGEIQV